MKFVFMSIGGNSVGIFGDLYIESAYQFVHEVPLEEYHICEVYFQGIQVQSQWFQVMIEIVDLVLFEYDTLPCVYSEGGSR